MASAYSSHISYAVRTMPLAILRGLLCITRTAAVGRPYDALIVCKNNPAATIRLPYDVKIIVPKSYGDRTATVRCPLILFAR